jgi:hypothetical protein
MKSKRINPVRKEELCTILSVAFYLAKEVRPDICAVVGILAA